MNKYKNYNKLFLVLIFLSICSCSNNENEYKGMDTRTILKEKKEQEITSLLNKHSCINLVTNVNYKTHFYQKNIVHKNILFESKPNDVFELKDKFILFTSTDNKRYLDYYLEISVELADEIQLDSTYLFVANIDSIKFKDYQSSNAFGKLIDYKKNRCI